MAKRAEITRAFALSGNGEEDKQFLEEKVAINEPPFIAETG
jgi:hypothetical protein